MSTIDWKLLIGYEWQDAQEYLADERVEYRVVITKPPRKNGSDHVTDEQEYRVIAVQKSDQEQVAVVVSPLDWTVS